MIELTQGSERVATENAWLRRAEAERVVRLSVQRERKFDFVEPPSDAEPALTADVCVSRSSLRIVQSNFAIAPLQPSGFAGNDRLSTTSNCHHRRSEGSLLVRVAKLLTRRAITLADRLLQNFLRDKARARQWRASRIDYSETLSALRIIKRHS